MFFEKKKKKKKEKHSIIYKEYEPVDEVSFDSSRSQ